MVSLLPLVRDEDVNHTVQMIEKGENVKPEFAPSFLHGSVQLTSVHDRRWIVKTRTAYHRTMHVSVDVICDKRNVEKQRAPLAGEKVENVVRGVNRIFRENQRVQIVALIYRIFIIRFELIEGDNVPDGEENKEGGKDQSDDVAECRECKRHLFVKTFTRVLYA